MKKAPGHRITDDREFFFSVLSAVDGLAVFEGEGHAAIGVDGSVVQQAVMSRFFRTFEKSTQT